MLGAAFRAGSRTLLLLLTLVEYLLRFLLLRLRRGNSLSLADRAGWMSAGCKTILRRMGWELCEQGQSPATGLIVSNHLSHLDILFYSASAGCIFLAKSEVKQWPLFGLLARCGGTIFVEREHAASAAQSAGLLQAALQAGVPVLLFPEGTSSDGAQVLPFYSMLFEPAVASHAPVAAAALAYSAEGAGERELCYYGSLRFVPHLLRCVGLAGVRAHVDWTGVRATYACRKAAARHTWAAVSVARQHVDAWRESPRTPTEPITAAPGALTPSTSS